MDTPVPDFESIKQLNPYAVEYWSARDLAPLLGYSKWQNFAIALAPPAPAAPDGPTQGMLDL